MIAFDELETVVGTDRLSFVLPIASPVNRGHVDAWISRSRGGPPAADPLARQLVAVAGQHHGGRRPLDRGHRQQQPPVARGVRHVVLAGDDAPVHPLLDREAPIGRFDFVRRIEGLVAVAPTPKPE